jgi:hypothetical protein
MKIRPALRWTAGAVLLVSGFSVSIFAGTFTSAALLAPLSPGQESRLRFTMPAGFAPDKPVWLVYDLVALSPNDDVEGQVDFEQSFEAVKTPLAAFYVSFKANDMESRKSAGTIAQRLEHIAGQRTPAELKRLMGEQMYAAYESVNAGMGRVMGGRMIRRLPAPGKSDADLLVSVERAQGMQPLALKVTVGQGPLPAQFQQKTEDSLAYKAGYGAGLGVFGWLVMRFFRRRRD